MKEPTDEIQIKDVFVFGLLLPIITCIVYIRKIKYLNLEEHAGIIVGLSYVILSLFISLAITYNLIPIYVYLISSALFPFFLTTPPLKHMNFIKGYVFYDIVNAYLKKHFQKKTVVRLSIYSHFGGMYSSASVIYYEKNNRYASEFKSVRLKKWDDK